MLGATRDDGPPRLVLDAGNLLSLPGSRADPTRLGGEQKADLILRAYAAMGVDALGVGEGDLAFGLGWLVQRAEALSLPLVSANLFTTQGERVFPGWRVLDAGDVRTGVFGLTGGGAACVGCAVADPTEAAREAVEVLRGQGCHLIVALAQLNNDDAAALAAAVPGIDFLLLAGDGVPGRVPQLVDETWLLRSTTRGRQITDLQVTFAEDASGFYSAELTAKALAERAANQARIQQTEDRLSEAATPVEAARHERALARMLALGDRLALADLSPDGRHTLALSKVQLDETVRDHLAIAAMVEEAVAAIPEPVEEGIAVRRIGRLGDFVGSSTCRACHPGPYRHYQATRHSGAYLTLIREQRHMDDACVECHATGFFLDGGPRAAADVGYLRVVQCEACHGPSAGHAADPQVATPLKGRAEETCVACHNEASQGGAAPEFSPEWALEAVRCPAAAPAAEEKATAP